MDAVSELLLNGIFRTTLCTTLAALMVLLFLPFLGVRSTRIHRTAWVLVILQGWVLVPLTFTVSLPSATESHQFPDTSINHSEPPVTIHSASELQFVESSSWQRYGKQVVVGSWLLGTLAVLGFSMRRYFSMVAHAPLGRVPESGDWKNEWREVADAMSPKANAQLRVTNQFGPLLCFVPFVYLVLVPRLLWASLSRNDRIAILRHELAHLNHGDLWKNLAIRLLALPQWFNPLAWLAVRRFEETGEWACDEEVLASSSLANTGYANTLLRVAGFAANTPCGAVAASGGVLSRRVTRLLSSSDKEVSKMKNLAVPLLLLTLAFGQAIRIESVRAEEPAKPTTTKMNAVESNAVEARAEAVARWRAAPYIVEPPDVLIIELEWENFDSARTFKTDSFTKEKISHYFMIEGVESLHEVDGGTHLMAKKLHLRGKHLVGPDGRVKLGSYGSVYVAGMTVAEVRAAIGRHLSLKMEKPEVFVEVLAYNSKVYYVIEKRPSGDCVLRLPITGNETVLDALAASQVKTNIDDTVYISLPAGPDGKPAACLVVDIKALLGKGDVTTNYQLLPGDRIFVEADVNGDARAPASRSEPTPAIPAEPYRSSPLEDRTSGVNEREETNYITVYDVEDLAVWRQSEKGGTKFDPSLLVNHIKSTIAPSSWKEDIRLLEKGDLLSFCKLRLITRRLSSCWYLCGQRSATTPSTVCLME